MRAERNPQILQDPEMSIFSSRSFLSRAWHSHFSGQIQQSYPDRLSSYSTHQVL